MAREVISVDEESSLNEEYDIDTARQRREQADQLARDRMHAKMVLAVAAVILIIAAIWLVSKSSKTNEDEALVYSVPDSSSQADSADDEQTAAASENTGVSDKQASAETAIYMLDSYTAYYANEDLSYTAGTLSGLYTGRVSDSYSTMIEIDYLGGNVLVNSTNALKLETSAAMALVGVSQFAYNTSGGSACPVACLAMLADDSSSFSSLYSYAESGGYADQGSLSSSSGGMTYDAVKSLAADYYGLSLVNAYIESEAPSETIKSLLDSGYNVLALVMTDSSANITASQGAASHFIVINGYSENEGNIEFFYANSYVSGTDSVSLSHISSDIIDSTVSASFDEPNTIAYISDAAG